MGTANWKLSLTQTITKGKRSQFTDTIRKRVSRYFLLRAVHNTNMRTVAVFAVILIGTWLVPSIEAKDTIRDKSPDGKFALQITKEDEGWAAAIIVGDGERRYPRLWPDNYNCI